MGAPLLAHRPGCLLPRPSAMPVPSLAGRALKRPSCISAALPSRGSCLSQPAIGVARGLLPSRPSPLQPSQQLSTPSHVASASSAAAQDMLHPSQPSDNLFTNLVHVVQAQLHKYTSLGGKFMPMVGLFFLLAFVNTILDSLKDTLVITAVGGGANVIPYLTVYAVLPSSVLFLVLYSLASQRMSRRALFNGIVATFMAFFVVFATVLYPNHQAIHLDSFADGLAQVLPSGLGGLVGMVRNWTFTLFFCMSELWGDVCLGLLFWGLANDTTSLSDAATLYPLFGLGANVAQALAGFVLKFFSNPGSSSGSFSGQIQSLMSVIMVFSTAALALHHYISEEDKKRKAVETTERRVASLARASAHAAASVPAQTSFNGNGTGRAGLVSPSANGLNGSSRAFDDAVKLNGTGSGVYANGNGNGAHANGYHANGTGNGTHAVHLNGSSSSSSYDVRSTANTDFSAQPSTSAPTSTTTAKDTRAPAPAKDKKPKPSLGEIFGTLSGSTAIRCLAVMSMAQGLCSSLMEFAWKSHIRLLYPSPALFTAFLGDVSTWQGVVTGCLMVLSPTMFEKLGWKGVAGTTPNIMMFGGGAFFAACLAYQFVFAPASGVAASAMGAATLKLLVLGGALLYVFSKSAKFSLFKPAEEMVYISLDQEGRTKGKAAIDVVGSQAGKSGGSMMQQALLLATGGAIAGTIPVMAIVFMAMTQGWLGAVGKLALQNNYGHEESVAARQLAEETARQIEEDSEIEEEMAWHSQQAAGHGHNGNGYNGNGNGNGNGYNGNGHAALGYSNGLANSHANGFANGNGHANGYANGHINGHINGYSNGHANGYANGHSHGVANGYSNLTSYSSVDVDEKMVSVADRVSARG